MGGNAYGARGLFLSAFIANFLIKAILLKLLDRIVQKTSFGQDEELKSTASSAVLPISFRP